MTATERRIKKKILGTPQEALVRFPKGFGDVCLAECQAFFPAAMLEENAVKLSGIAFRDLLTLAISSRTSREILWQLVDATAKSAKQLKERLESVEWDLLVQPGMTFGIRVESTASNVFHEGKIRELVGAELVKHSCAGGPVRDADHLIDVRLKKDRLTLRLSVAGKPLHHRGYKQSLQGVASVKEDIAASAILASLAFYREARADAFVPDAVWVPFAGSGTLGFEALLQFGSLPPSLFFGPLSADSWPCSPKATVAHVRKAQLALARPTPLLEFGDTDQDQVAALKENIAAFDATLVRAGLAPGKASLTLADALDGPRTPAAVRRRLFVPLNPPYGERLGSRESVADLLKHLAKRLSTLEGDVLGFVFVPTEAVADRFAEALKPWKVATRSFNHGGRNVYQVSFLNP